MASTARCGSSPRRPMKPPTPPSTPRSSTSRRRAPVLKKSGNNLPRDNVMKQPASLKNLELGMLLPGMRINTGPNDFAPIKQMQMGRFNGESYELFGPLMTGAAGG